MPQRFRLLLQVIFCLSLGLSLMSCRDPSVPVLYKITGQVLLDGTPLPGAKVIFQPASGVSPSTCTTNEDGYYMLQYTNIIAGVVAGEHLVTIEKISPDGSEELPTSYNSASKLKVNIHRNSNPVNFHLKSDGSIPPEYTQQETE